MLGCLPDLSSLTRDRTHRLSSESAESSPLDHQGIPSPGVLAGKKGVVVWACPWPLPTLNTNPEARTTASASPFVNLWLRVLLDQLPVCRQEACGILGSALQAPPGFLAWVWRVGGQDPRAMVNGQHQPEVKKHATLHCEYSPNQASHNCSETL